jgi:hypothetical protein
MVWLSLLKFGLTWPWMASWTVTKRPVVNHVLASMTPTIEARRNGLPEAARWEKRLKMLGITASGWENIKGRLKHQAEKSKTASKIPTKSLE